MTLVRVLFEAVIQGAATLDTDEAFRETDRDGPGQAATLAE